MASAFLTAEWRKLAMANYVVDPAVLQPLVPRGTELDLWKGRAYVSLVGFRFLNTRIKGLRIPCHVNFEEVNLRFYVKHKTPQGEVRRGVSFIMEIVPRMAISYVARRFYGEPYETMRMRHAWVEENGIWRVEYGWECGGEWQVMGIKAGNQAEEMPQGSEAEFITEHYWGYTGLGAQTSEYGVEHPRWKVYPVKEYVVKVDFGTVYGEKWAFLNQARPDSVLLAEGSEIVVRSGRKLAPSR